MNSPSDVPTSPPRSTWLRWIPFVVLPAVIGAGLAFWQIPRGQVSPEELAAKAELTKLGALVVMDPERKFVNSVNLSTLKSPETFDRAIELLPALARVKSLNFNATPFRDEHAPSVAQLRNLQDLVLNNTEVTDAALQTLAGLSGLSTLYLVNTNVTSAGLPAIGQMDSLKILDLSGTKVAGDFEPLQELSELNWLVAQRLSLDAAAITALGKCQSLTRLTLKETTVPEEAVSQLERERPNLTIDR
ncbi:MAG: hypothetical protein WD851_00880 [Pirellulales bacterium]